MRPAFQTLREIAHRGGRSPAPFPSRSDKIPRTSPVNTGEHDVLEDPLAAAAAAVLAAGLTVPASAAARGGFTPVPLPFFWPDNSLHDNFYATSLADRPRDRGLWTLGNVNISGPVVLTDG
jgi:hypothetical protein